MPPPVSDYVEGMEEKVQPLVVKKGILSETEINKLGKKDPEAYPCDFYYEFNFCLFALKFPTIPYTLYAIMYRNEYGVNSF